MGTLLKNIVQGSEAYARLVNSKVLDIRKIEEWNDVDPPMVDFVPKEEILGTFQIEKFISTGFYLGPKQYAMVCSENGGPISRVMKIKGVFIPREN